LKLFLLAGVFFLIGASAHGSAVIDWAALRNPVLQYEHWSIKDAAMVYDSQDEVFYIFFSAFFRSDWRIRCHVSAVKTHDFKEFSDPLFVWSGVEHGYKGLCSPNISHINGEYVLTYNSWGDKWLQPNQLFYLSFQKLSEINTWTSDQPHRPLAADLTDRRAIDAALTFRDGLYYLIWKEKQTPQIAVANDLAGRWQRLGRPLDIWFENAQLLEIDGWPHMLMTADQHMPYLSALDSTPEAPGSWLHWSSPAQFNIPRQSFNTKDVANAAFVADFTEYDGYFYLLYAGNTEKKTFKRRGHNRLGLARSRDLTHWESLPEQ
jgi:hypothetical protein